jgi:hypothetical protein
VDLVHPARKQPQHPSRIIIVNRLGQDGSVNLDCRIGSHHYLSRTSNSHCLFDRQAPDIFDGWLGNVHGLVDVRRPNLETEPNL